MIDPRVVELARILTDYSIRIKKGDLISIDCGMEAQPLVLEICKNILKKGAIPKVNAGMPGYAYTYYKYAPDEVLKTFPQLAEMEAKMAAGSIGIGAEYNTRELTSIDSKKFSIRRKVIQPIRELSLKKNNWVICQYPTNALAQDADMSLEEFEDFAYNATNQDWAAVDKKQTKLKEVIDKGEMVYIIGKDTDLTFSIKGRQGIKCAGNRNMPDGEVFCGPVETSTEGHISYSFPAIYGGKEVDGIRLWFKNGAVVNAKATKNEDLLHAMLETDKGAKFLGEFGIGFNFGIQRFIKQILFDEKIGGTIHLALGMAYKEGGGKNESAVHWDMIKDLRDGGEFWVDKTCIQKNGKFLVRL
ncbi:aminopeptidase [Candidatus Woesearchaeota archaeon]|nr:aminopeptidase [Candidatus Woesearchaeota archaeon]